MDVFGRGENMTGAGEDLNVVAGRDDLLDWDGSCRRDELGGGSGVGLRR